MVPDEERVEIFSRIGLNKASGLDAVFNTVANIVANISFDWFISRF